MQKEENQQCNYYTDADFCRNWKIATVHLDRSAIRTMRRNISTAEHKVRSQN